MTGILGDPLFSRHETGIECPEVPGRYAAAMSGIEAAVPAQRRLAIPARNATEQDLCLCHTADYIERVRLECAQGRHVLSTGDTDLCPATYEVARRAVGAVLAAVDAVMAGVVRNAFCPVRPPGHHAGADGGMGFCVFNNVAIGARHLQRRHGIERVLIVDWDVHHGNGTQDLFVEDPAVFYFSTHQWPSYPGSGRACHVGSGPGRGATLNCPLGAGSGRREMEDAFRGKLVPAAERFRPQFVLVSAGFDAEGGDPLGGFALWEEDFAALTRIVLGIADRFAEGRLVSVLEGGYRLEGLAAMVGAHVRELAAYAGGPAA
jgi:acetoin utilization deacetylase AcuC-like enzyme